MPPQTEMSEFNSENSVRCGGCRRKIKLMTVNRIGAQHSCLLKLLQMKIPNCTPETAFCNQCYIKIAERNNKECVRSMKRKIESSIEFSSSNDSASITSVPSLNLSTSSSLFESSNTETSKRNNTLSPPLDEYDEMIVKTPMHPVNQALVLETTMTLRRKLLASKSFCHQASRNNESEQIVHTNESNSEVLIVTDNDTDNSIIETIPVESSVHIAVADNSSITGTDEDDSDGIIDEDDSDGINAKNSNDNRKGFFTATSKKKPRLREVIHFPGPGHINLGSRLMGG